MAKTANKRRNKRLTCVVPLEGQEGGVFDSTNVIDFSKGGLGFISSRRIPVNKRIPIQLDLQEDDMPVLVIGRVKWTRAINGTGQFRIGVTFEEVMHGSKTRLQKYFRDNNE